MRNFQVSPAGSRRSLDLARVLLVYRELAPRLALQTILRAGGYVVDVATTAAEAFDKLDRGRYELVLSDSTTGASASGRNLLAYARMMEYAPATAVVTSSEPTCHDFGKGRRQISIHTEDLPELLAEVAELIGVRAIRRYRPLGQAV